MAQYYCSTCGKTMDENQFYTSYNTEKYPPDGKLNECKKCLTMFVDNWNPETYKPILQEIDVPYIKDEWNKLLEKYGQNPDKITGTTILGRYLSKMKLKQWNWARWADTEKIAADIEEKKIAAMRTKGFSGEQIDAELAVDHTPTQPVGITQTASPQQFVPMDEPDPLADSLTDEDKVYLRMKWGKNYRPEEWVRMEQLYNDMMASYDIQGAGHLDNLIMLCKTSLKANQLLDIGDVEGFQKMSKAYDQLMKMGKFTAQQNKGENGEFIDSVGELVALCEKEGFIPRYYVDGPQDKVDRTLEDYKRYVQSLVAEETNLTNMLDNAMKQIEEDRAREAKIDVDDSDEDEALEAELFDSDTPVELTEEDYKEFADMEEEAAFDDEQLLRDLRDGD